MLFKRRDATSKLIFLICSRPLHPRYRHPGRQRRHQLRLPQDGGDLPSPHRSIRPLRPPRSRPQPHHVRRPLRPAQDRARAQHGDPPHPQSHRQKPLCGRVPAGGRRGSLTTLHPNSRRKNVRCKPGTILRNPRGPCNCSNKRVRRKKTKSIEISAKIFHICYDVVPLEQPPLPTMPTQARPHTITVLGYMAPLSKVSPSVNECPNLNRGW